MYSTVSFTNILPHQIKLFERAVSLFSLFHEVIYIIVFEFEFDKFVTAAPFFFFCFIDILF